MERSTLIRHIEAGLTHVEIAKLEGVANGTVQYWLRKLELKTKWKRGGWSKTQEGKHRTPSRTSIAQMDWVQIQQVYDTEGLSLKGLGERFKTCVATLMKASKMGLFKTRSFSEASKLSHTKRDYSPYRTDEFRKNAAKNGGYKPRSGTGKGAWVKNITEQSFYLQSSYEIRMAVLLNKASILWERPEGIPYTIDGVERRYYPDFILPAFSVYLDTKNDYLIPIDAPKIEAVKAQSGITLHVIREAEINATHLALIIPNIKPQLEGAQLDREDWLGSKVPRAKRLYVPRPKRERQTKMPSAETLRELIWQMPLTDIAIQFGVGDTAVQKWLNKLKIERPPCGYWMRRQHGRSHEEALKPAPKKEPIPRRFTDEQILTIRARIAAGEKLLPLAREYGVCHKTMRDIRDGLRYKELL